jgi:two-component system, OmpR family, alkaline phosphatase synthesis response regulator PhoP
MPKILIVEDDAMISSMYKIKLEQAGYEVFIAETGLAGLEMAADKRPDIILLDVILPQMDGFSLLEEIKSNKNLKNIPVVMLTNLGTDEDKEKGKSLGAVDYLVKAGLTPSEIADIIKKYI